MALTRIARAHALSLIGSIAGVVHVAMEQGLEDSSTIDVRNYVDALEAIYREDPSWQEACQSLCSWDNIETGGVVHQKLWMVVAILGRLAWLGQRYELDDLARSLRDLKVSLNIQ